MSDTSRGAPHRTRTSSAGRIGCSPRRQRSISTSISRAMAPASAGRASRAVPAAWSRSRASPSGTAARIGRPDATILVGLLRHDRRPPAGRQIVHRQEEQVGGADECGCLPVAQEPVQRCVPDCSRLCCSACGENPGEVQLDDVAQLGTGIEKSLEPLDQEQMRAGEEVDAVHEASRVRAADPTPPAA